MRVLGPVEFATLQSGPLGVVPPRSCAFSAHAPVGRGSPVKGAYLEDVQVR